MKKNRGRSIIAGVLLAAFLLWLVSIAFPTSKPKPRKGLNNTKSKQTTTYEPKFKREGRLYFIAEEGDTLKQIDIEFADTPDKIQYGMMYRKSMDPNTGMLFFMPREERQSFWMKNTYVPLDIMYINGNSEVVSIQKNAEPLSEKSLPSEGPANRVLEVFAGFSDLHQIEKGTKIVYQRY